MGLAIGQSPAALNSLRGVQSPRATSFFDERTGSGISLPGRDKSSEGGPFFRGPRGGTPSTGATSGPSAAFNALNRTVQEVRKFVPSIQELNIVLQRNASASRAASREQAESAFFGERSTAPSESSTSSRSTNRRIELRRPEPAAQARSFITALNTAAGDAQRLFSGDATSPSGPPSFQVGGRSFSFNAGTGTVLNLKA
jgi:hypothetical protein